MATAMQPRRGEEFPVAGFDYDSLPETTRQLVVQRADLIRDLLRKTSSQALKIGMALNEVRPVMDQAQWHAWYRHELRISVSGAARYMKQADVFAGEPGAEELSFSAMEVLIPSHVAQAARDEALAVARSGRHVSKQLALEIIQRHRSESERVRGVPYEVDRLKQNIRRSLGKLVAAWPAGEKAAMAESVREVLQQVLAEYGLAIDGSRPAPSSMARKLGILPSAARSR